MSDESPVDPQGERAAFEVLAQNSHYFVGHDDEGYGVWNSHLGTEQPTARFPDTDEGVELSFERFRLLTRQARTPGLLRILFGISMAGGLLWVAGSVYETWDYLRFVDLGSSDARSDDQEQLRLVLSVISTVAYPVFLVAFGTFVSIWMWSRRPTSEG